MNPMSERSGPRLPPVRHRRVRDAVLKDGDQRDIGRRVDQLRAVEAWRVAAGAAGAVALRAHPLKEQLATVDVGLVLRADSDGYQDKRNT
jgi:hypothetical protein